MPEKKKNTKKKETNKKTDKNVLKELAHSLKFSEEPEEKISEDEENELNLKNFDFIPSIDSEESSAPVLEKIAGSGPRPIFVGGIPQSMNQIQGEDKSDPFKYVSGQNSGDEPKYIDSDSHIRTEMERVDFNRIGREEFRPEIKQENMFMHSQEANLESQFQEKVWAAERFDVERERRKDRSERDDKYKPDLPKSR